METVRGDFVVQNDSYNFGPLTCLKLMELFRSFILKILKKCYKRRRIRSVIVDEWEHLGQACDHDGILRVKDSRSDVATDDGGYDCPHQHSDNSGGAINGGNNAQEDDSYSHFSSLGGLAQRSCPLVFCASGNFFF
jgi:hypothetical protein